MLSSDEPDVEAICREGLYVVLSEVVTVMGEYNSTYDLTELDTNVEVLFGVTATMGVRLNYVQSD
jgi:hypothetical protein